MSVIEEAKELLLGPGSFRVYFSERNGESEIKQVIYLPAENRADACNKFDRLKGIKDIYITKVERE